MTENRGHIRSYSAEEIRQYLEGRMNPDAMHELEKQALDDPFLSDALEGMAHYLSDPQNPAFGDSMQDLEKRLTARVSREKNRKGIFLFPRWVRIAAALAGLVLVVYITNRFLLTRSRDDQDMAKSTEPRQLPDSSQSLAKQSQDKADSALAKNSDDKKNQPQPPVLPNTEKVLADANKIAAARPIKKQEEKPAGRRQSQSDEEAPQASGIAAAAPAAEPDSMAPKQKALTLAVRPVQSKEWKSRLLDANSMPVKGAEIRLTNSSQAAITNDKGEFTLQHPADKAKISVEISAPGYAPEIQTIDQNGLAKSYISIHSDSSFLKEVVVSDYRAKQIRESSIDERNAADLNAGTAEPAGGWKAYYEFIKKHKKINMADSVLRGTEIISFVVDKKGKLSSFRSEQSLSKSHYAEALRLVREGPAWISLKGGKQRVTLYINF